MLLKGYTQNLIKDAEKTYLTASIGAATGVILTVKAVDGNAWADNDWIIIGEIGNKTTEVAQVNGSVTDGVSLTFDNAGSGGTRYAHSIDEPVYRISFNQIEFSYASTISGSKSVLATAEIQPDELFTRYEDVTNTSGFGFVRFKNATTSVFSAYSIGVPYSGYPAKSLFRMIRNVRRFLGLNIDDRAIADEDIIDELNEKQRDVYHERLWGFAEEEFSFSSVANTSDYSLTSRIAPGKVHTLRFDSQPLVKLSQKRWEIAHFDSNSTGDPTHCSIFGNRIRVYPIPTSAADTDQLNGSLTATATSITVDSTSGFAAPGRVLIESEVISYDAISSTQLLGCRRGLEGTTAAIHADDTAITERDFIGTGHAEPEELVDMNDETGIPDPRVLETGVAMELALTPRINDQALHDRMKNKYDQARSELREKFGRKMTGTFFTIRDKDDYPTDGSGVVNPNDFPQDIS